MVLRRQLLNCYEARGKTAAMYLLHGAVRAVLTTTTAATTTTTRNGTKTNDNKKSNSIDNKTRNHRDNGFSCNNNTYNINSNNVR